MDSLFRALVRLGVAVAVGAVALVGLGSAPAGAHETREVGDYEMVVGWGNEPTFTGFENRVQLILSDSEGEPVTELGDTLEVEVSFDDEVVTLPIEPFFVVDVFGEPGDYGADVIPTRPGTYTFRFVGSINGQDIDESFTSGPDTFDEPRAPADIEFPVADPSNAELSERLDREVERLAAGDDDSGVETGTVLGAVALGVAVLALGAAGFAARRART